MPPVVLNCAAGGSSLSSVNKDDTSYNNFYPDLLEQKNYIYLNVYQNYKPNQPYHSKCLPLFYIICTSTILAPTSLHSELDKCSELTKITSSISSVTP